MKKFSILGIMALVALLLCVLSGCPAEDEEKTPASMIFVDDLDNPAKQFTIDENFNFKVTFINPNAMEAAMQLNPGEVISGKIKEADAAWNSDLTGLATSMSSTNSTINPVVGDIGPIAVSFVYTKEGSAITGVTLAFLGEDAMSLMAQMLMGATYLKK
jgi:hypothetical protein